MRVTIIAAVADNGVIGQGNDIPWRLPEDWRYFKRTTMGHHLIMGRRTWDSIGRPLPGRTTIVVSRGRPELPKGVRLAHSLEQALDFARQAGDDEAFVAGGAEIFRRTLPLADRILLTRVRAEPDGDTTFPHWEPSEWELTSEEIHPADEQHAFSYTFETYDRSRQPSS